MKKLFQILLFTCLFQVASAQMPNERPKMVVGIVVDQMRNEYIHRYYDDFQEDGFKRLIEKGFYYSNVHYNYFPTYTAPGHASVYTGTTPSVHGIVGNYWFHKGLGEDVYCTADDNHPVVGGEGKGMSSHRLMSTTLGDELKLTTNEKAKVIGLSIKDRGAILPAGHLGDAAYWFTDEGNFVSSTYFMENLPEWVNEFNERKLPIEYIKKGWDKSEGVSFDESLADDNAYESRLGGKDAPVFPYDLSDMIKQGGIGSMRATPYGNDLIVDLAEATIQHEDLGKDDVTDLLAVSFSSTDYVGHAMGTRAIETQDTYIRLDKSIARLLKFLDETVGANNYLVCLTADHGGGEPPQYLADRNFNVKALDSKDIKEELKTFSIEQYGENVVQNFSNNGIYFNREVMSNLKLDESILISDFRQFLLKQAYVKRVYSYSEILQGNAADPFLTMLANGYDFKQNGELLILLEPGYMFYKNTGTTHGSPYAYDTHVPAIFYGWNIPQGRSHRRYTIDQLAPTLSQKINISIPSGSTSDVLLQILE